LIGFIEKASWTLMLTIWSMSMGQLAFGHDWYPPGCCSDRDCRPVACSDIRTNADGSADYLPEHAHFEKVQQSPDAQCHACTRRSLAHNDGRYNGYCVYVPGMS
jgi:hypothetical protein